MTLAKGNIIEDLRNIVAEGRQSAYRAVNKLAVQTYWNIGKRIVEEEQGGENHARYGSRLIASISSILSQEFGAGFSERDLRRYRQFYLNFKDLEIWHTRVPNLSWSHFKRIMSVADPKARVWYTQEASEQMWSIRTLDRNISTQYYGRMMAAQRDNLNIPSPQITQPDPLEYIKNPMVAEFLGFKKNTHYDENDLEQALIDNLKDFIMELGKGFAFVERQKHISTETSDFYIDLVFYNYRLKSFVLFELKTHAITHQDIGQLDMYVRMYDDLIKNQDDNPTIGVLLCTETDNTIARYSVLNDNEHLFASKYMAYLPTEAELQHEIEQQKQYFLDLHQHKPKTDSHDIK